MSLFGKMKAGLKSVTNRVTGGYGEVSIETDGVVFHPGGEAKAKVVVTAKEDLKATKITARLHTVEGAKFNDDYKENLHAAVFNHRATFEEVLELCGELEMNAGEVREFDAVFQLPEDLQPTMQGKYVTHVCTLSVEVDIPWGVDLRKQTELFVTPPKIDKRTPLKLVQQNRNCKVLLDVPNARVDIGDTLQFNLFLCPLQKIFVESVEIGIQAVEIMDAELTFRQPNPDYDGEGEQIQVLSKERGEIELVTYEDFDIFLERKEVTENIPLFNTLSVPEAVAGSYRGEDVHCRVYIVARINIEGCETLELRDEILALEQYESKS